MILQIILHRFGSINKIMNSLKELKRKQIEIHEKYGSKYFIFIGPSNIQKATELGIFEHYVYRKNQVPTAA